MNKILMPITQSGPDFVNSNGYIIRGYIDKGKFIGQFIHPVGGEGLKKGGG